MPGVVWRQIAGGFEKIQMLFVCQALWEIGLHQDPLDGAWHLSHRAHGQRGSLEAVANHEFPRESEAGKMEHQYLPCTSSKHNLRPHTHICNNESCNCGAWRKIQQRHSHKYRYCTTVARIGWHPINDRIIGTWRRLFDAVAPSGAGVVNYKFFVTFLSM